MYSIVDFALALQVLFWVVLCGAFAASRQFSLYHPNTFYLFFHGLVFVLRPLVVRYAGLDVEWRYLRFFPTDAEFMEGLAASTLGLLVFVPVCWMGAQMPIATSNRTTRGMSIGERQAVWLTVLLFAPLGIYSAIKYPLAADAGKAGTHGLFILTKANGYVLDAKNLLAPLALLIVVASRFRWWGLLPLLGYLAFRSTLGSGRWSIIMPTATLLLMYFYRTRSRNTAILVSSLVTAAAFLVFAFMGATRGAHHSEHVSANTLGGAKMFKTIMGPDFANFEYLTYVVAVVPEKSGGSFSYFTDALALFIAPIPRTLWPEKPQSNMPIELVDLFKSGNFIGRTPTAVGTGWIGLGWPGIVMMMSVLAASLAWTYRWFARNHDNMRAQLAYLMFLPLTLQWFRDGGFLSMTKFSMWSLLPILSWIFLSRVFSGEPLLGGKPARPIARPRGPDSAFRPVPSRQDFAPPPGGPAL